ncbi:MAG: polysaccharide biosynthesis protein [Gammaproteobacteria bacterium]
MAVGDLQVGLIQLPRRTKRIIAVIADAAVMVAALALTILLIHQTEANAIAMRWPLIIAVVLVAIPVFTQQGLYRAIIRFIGSRMVFAVLRSVTFVALVLGCITLVLGADPVADVFSTILVFWSFGLLGMVGSRFFTRMYLIRQTMPGERVAIYGAGEAGVHLAAVLTSGNEFAPVAFIDDNMAVQGRSINGLQVYSSESLHRIVAELGIKRVLLALPSISRRKRQDIISNLETMPVHVQTMPDISDLVSGAARVDEIRDVTVADLLGRDSVPPNDKLLDACIRSKSVAVTGAGGSIGSELCRQIVLLGPKRLLLLEVSEHALYQIERELRESVKRDSLDVEIVGLLGSVHHQARVRNVLATYEVNTVYHAAAYKHVPMVEHNMIEGIHNNIFGTLHTALAAEEAGVEAFVLVSTDKAVSPANVMGATKRFAELVLQGLHERGSKTRFCMVRFGNVLASSGSVVPLFREQIRRGGPVTVTHPEIIRYFMTIPEAAQLVIQAGSMGQGGDVFVLDMGRPVRIEDLARRMIHLMGLSVRDEDDPDGDIAIEYTGLRPAEKLYEELLIGNNVMGTEHPMIMRAQEDCLSWERVEDCIDDMSAAIGEFDCASARQLLLASVEGYTPTSGIEDLVWRVAHADPVQAAKVTDLDSRRSGAG